MQVECVKAFGTSVPGDVVEVPDGSVVDPEHWKVIPAVGPPAARPAPSLLSAVTVTPKEGM